MRVAGRDGYAGAHRPALSGTVRVGVCLGSGDEPVAIRHIEQTIADRGFAEGSMMPRPPRRETASAWWLSGSGPAGLAAAQQLRRFRHAVVVFEAEGIDKWLREGSSALRQA